MKIFRSIFFSWAGKYGRITEREFDIFYSLLLDFRIKKKGLVCKVYKGRVFI